MWNWKKVFPCVWHLNQRNFSCYGWLWMTWCPNSKITNLNILKCPQINGYILQTVPHISVRLNTKYNGTLEMNLFVDSFTQLRTIFLVRNMINALTINTLTKFWVLGGLFRYITGFNLVFHIQNFGFKFLKTLQRKIVVLNPGSVGFRTI